MANELQQDVGHDEDIYEALYNSVVKATLTERKDDGLLFKTEDGEHTIFVGEQELGRASGLEIGDEAPILLARRKDDIWWGSIDYAQALDLWDRLEALAKKRETIEGEVVGTRSDGLVVDVLGVRAVVPSNQIDIHRVDDLDSYIGRTETFQVIKFDTRRGELTLSRRKVIEAEQKAGADAFMKTLEKGQVHEGVVRTVLNYGAFININGVEGLLHKSNMTWGRLDDPRGVYNPGQLVQVKVLDYDRDRDRLSLGVKQLGDDPWEGFSDRYSIGGTYTGKVVSLTRFGAFLELEPGIEGLLHVSEISWTERIRHPREVYKLEDEVEFKLLEADLDERKLRLSARELKPNPWQTIAEAHQPGDVLELPITSIVDFGFFVELQPGVEGLVHLSELSWTKHHKSVPNTYSVGDTVKVALISVDAENTRASLSIKQLEPDPWEKAETIAKPGEKIPVTIARLVEGLGAFAEVVPGVEGLIHVSEVQEERFETLSSVLSEGQETEALVISFDRNRQRISLTLKRDELTPEERGVSSREVSDDFSDDGEATTDLGALLKQKLSDDLIPEDDDTSDAEASDNAEPSTDADSSAEAEASEDAGTDSDAEAMNSEAAESEASDDAAAEADAEARDDAETEASDDAEAEASDDAEAEASDDAEAETTDDAAAKADAQTREDAEAEAEAETVASDDVATSDAEHSAEAAGDAEDQVDSKPADADEDAEAGDETAAQADEAKTIASSDKAEDTPAEDDSEAKSEAKTDTADDEASASKASDDKDKA